MESRPAGMLCPVCRVDLVMSERQGVEIDYCPKCRGVWLDRGELDKVIEKSAADIAPPPAPARPAGRDYDERRERPRYYDDDDHKHRHGYYKKRKSILGEIFDF
jgi:Zn-finger nucleic acid-binding protein